MRSILKYSLCLMLLWLALGNPTPVMAEPHSPDAAENEADIQAYELDNGLQVLLVPKPGVDITLVDIWVGVGSADETEENNGISHFFEHMVFKGTDTRPKTVDLEIESLGGSTNAATSLDWTHYYINVPSEHSIQALEILADITMNPNFPEDEILAEKNVVLRERDQRDDNPASAIYKQFFQEFYKEHPYRLPVIGTAEGLDPLIRDDFMSFLEKHYVPSNMTLVVVGNFDADEMLATAESTFGQMEAVAYEEPEHPTEEPLTEIVRLEERRDIVQSYMIMGWPGPAVADVEEVYAMDLLLSILSYGRGSRFYKNIQKDLGIVTAVSADYYTTQDPSIFYVYAQFPPEHQALIRDALLDELADVLEGNVTEEELDRAKTIMLSNIDLGRETNAGMASALGFYASVAGDYNFALEYGDNLRAATVDDVIAVAQKYIDLDAYQELTFVPEWYEEEEEAAETEGSDVLVLDNGLKLILREDDSSNVVALQAFVGAGNGVESAENAGISMMTQSLLMRGTTTKSEAEIFEELENMGASMGQGILPDMGNLSLTANGDTWEDALPTYLDVLLNPALSEEEFLIVKDEMIRGVVGQGDNNWAIIFNNFRTELYGTDGYGSIPEGTPESLENISLEDVQNFYETYYVPNNMVVSAVGNFDAQRLKARLEGRLGALEMGADDLQPPRVTLDITENSEVFAEKDTNLDWIILGYPGPSVDSPDYPATKVLTGILGTGFTSRLFRTLREQQGLAYSTGAGFPSRKGDSFLYTYIIALPENADHAVQGILDIVTDIQENGVEEAELEKAKNKAIGDYVRAHETAERRAWYLGWYEMLDAGVELDETYPDLLRSVSSEDIQRVAGDYLDNYVLSSLGGASAEGDGTEGDAQEEDGSSDDAASDEDASAIADGESDSADSESGTESGTESGSESGDESDDSESGDDADSAGDDAAVSDTTDAESEETDSDSGDDSDSTDTEAGDDADSAEDDAGSEETGSDSGDDSDYTEAGDDADSAEDDADATDAEAEAEDGSGDAEGDDDQASDDMSDADEAKEQQSQARMDILTTAVLKGHFQILTEAVFAANLAEVLQSPGPYTLLAVPDDVLEAEGIESAPEGEEAVVLVLRHGLLGEYTFDDLYALDGETVTNLLGQELTVSIEDDTVMVGDATIVEADIPATNGVLHVVDNILGE